MISFFNQFYSMTVLQERWSIIDSILRDLERNVLRDPYQRRAMPVAATFRSSVESAVFRVMAMHQHLKPAQLKHIEQGDTFQLFADAVAGSATMMHGMRFRTPPLERGFADKFREAFNSADCSYEEAQPSVAGCYQMAIENFEMSQTRLVLLSALRHLVAPSEYSNVQLGGMDEVQTILWQASTNFLRHVALFGGLLKDSGAIKLLAEQMVYDPAASVNFSVMQFLQPNGIHPGSYLTATDDALRADIKKHYEQL